MALRAIAAVAATAICVATPAAADPCPEAPTPVPPDANRTIADPQQPARYVHSDTLTFTRDVAVARGGTNSSTERRSASSAIRGRSVAPRVTTASPTKSIFGYAH